MSNENKNTSLLIKVLFAFNCTFNADQCLVPSAHWSATFATTLDGFIVLATFSYNTVAPLSGNVRCRT
jgi:hypothetical protein